ncbi:dienelactone hydrolase family protein [Peribacillus frigoritolerans]|uniref:Dienelactone hydrolase family protein n=1 Tax=Peribacillus frigoritolerans TaxID=450367 RepID=A0AAJ1VE03_9BACI|nr:dienelactone hydrolase family protein [Peribacillus frigoritolerans]MDM5286210.1 dienelactone hydrolase family protein [Peribacillus frigoritolerans]
MLNIQKKSDTVIIVIHEIYGLNQHMQGYCELLSKQGFDVICPDLLERGRPFDYSQEDAAYRHFMENVGFTGAPYKIKDILSDIKDEYQKIFILGFSAGATVAWLCSEEECVDGIVGYYGSRIRNYAELAPRCPALLFFPLEEPSFNVDELISALESKNVEVHKYMGEHGFSDPYHSKYHAESAQAAVSNMMKFFMVN